MIVLKNFFCFLLAINILKASNFNDFTADQIVEFWAPKRETAYFITQSNFDPHTAYIFDLRQQRLAEDFSNLRQLPVVTSYPYTVPQLLADYDESDDDPFDGADLFHNTSKLGKLLSKIQSILGCFQQ